MCDPDSSSWQRSRRVAVVATAQSPAMLCGAECRAALVNRLDYLRVQMGHEVSETKDSITDSHSTKLCTTMQMYFVEKEKLCFYWEVLQFVYTRT